MSPGACIFKTSVLENCITQHREILSPLGYLVNKAVD